MDSEWILRQAQDMVQNDGVVVSAPLNHRGPQKSRERLTLLPETVIFPHVHPLHPVTRTERARQTVARLRVHIPQPETELLYGNPYELLLAVVLSAQCTDARVNMVTPALFKAFPNAHALAQASVEDIFAYIRSVSFPNNKARHLAGLGKLLVEQHGGEVPQSIEELVKLPGVGRKTAQVVVSVAFGIEALPVDTHVFRVANRIGLVPKDADTPDKVEKGLKAVLPMSDWNDGHHLFILHGRYTCQARQPKCDACPLTDLCLYFDALQKLPAPLTGLDPRKGKYYSPSSDTYFDEPAYKTDRYGVEQLADPKTGAMTVFETKTGKSTRRVKDYRV